VYRYLNSLSNNLRVLELNCGTGEDAIWFAKKGYTVLATDISNEMIGVAKQKAKGIDNLKFQQLDINNLCDIPKKRRTSGETSNYDLIFSNFGGLNCLNSDHLHNFFKNASKMINENGKLILVIMPKNTLWERVYFSFKGQIKKSKRRNTNKSLQVNVAEKAVETWYFNPKEIEKIAQVYFKVIKTKPIGFFIPPSYLEPFFRKHKLLLSILNIFEKSIGKIEFLSRFSDHYLIELKEK
jgi:cyclopropane fatty-acyl-phospholipid synthase-like methyltransferase